MTGITLHKNCSLSPTSEDELMEYTYYLLYHSQSLYECGRFGNSLDISNAWSNTEDERKWVASSSLWTHFKWAWEYAERGMGANKLNIALLQDNMMFLHRYAGFGQVVLEHDGNFACESTTVRDTGPKVLCKLLARFKLDFNVDLDSEFPLLHLFPLVYSSKLSTIEYALLAGMSHVGAVRNEVSRKVNPLPACKVGNNLEISIKDARARLLSKRKFVPSPNIDYASQL
jgi:hypothetical protein